MDGIGIKELGLRILSSAETTDNKIKMLTWLKDGRPPLYVEAQLDKLTLFLGFEPDPSKPLSSLRTSYLICTPRQTLPDIERTAKYTSIHKKLLTDYTQRLHALVLYENPWSSLYGEIVWYNLFSDQVSLYFNEDNGFKVVKRTELLNGSAEAGNTFLYN